MTSQSTVPLKSIPHFLCNLPVPRTTALGVPYVPPNAPTLLPRNYFARADECLRRTHPSPAFEIPRPPLQKRKNAPLKNPSRVRFGGRNKPRRLRRAVLRRDAPARSSKKSRTRSVSTGGRGGLRDDEKCTRGPVPRDPLPLAQRYPSSRGGRCGRTRVLRKSEGEMGGGGADGGGPVMDLCGREWF